MKKAISGFCRLVLGGLVFAACVANAEIRVGIYEPQDSIDKGMRTRSDAMADALNQAGGITARSVGGIDEETFKDLDVFILPNQSGGWTYGSHMEINDDAKRAFLRKWVEQGHGLMTTHDAVGYRKHKPPFPEVATGNGNFYSSREPYANKVCVNAEHPVSKGMKPRDIFATAYFDYISIQPGKDGFVVIRGAGEAGGRLFSGPPAVVAGQVGKGRYVACGLLLGALAPKATPEVPKDGELAVLVNSIRYLAGEDGYDPVAGTEGIGQGAFLAVLEKEDEDTELIPGVTIRKFVEECQIPFKAEWKKSSGTPPELDNVPDGTPVLSDEQYQTCMSAETYDRFPDSWKRVDLCGDWKFMELPDTQDNPEKDEGTVKGYWKADFDDSAWTNMPVPTEKILRPEIHKWRPCPIVGVMWFRRTFTVPESKGSRYVLRFGGADTVVDVYINGQKAGRHEGYGYPFEMDITDLVKPGRENVIAIRDFDGSANHRGRPVNGLYERIELQVRPEIYVRRILLNPVLETSTLELHVELFNGGKKKQVDLKGQITPYKSTLAKVKGRQVPASADLGKVELEPGMNELDLEIELKKPVLWSPDNPALYVLNLESDGKHIGKERFGFREFKVEGHFFYLNNKRINLTGMLLRPGMFMGGPAGGLFPNNPGHVMERRLMGYKNMNFNALLSDVAYRPELFFDLCDEVGLMVYSLNRYGPPYQASHSDIILWARTNRQPPKNIKVNPAYIRDIKGFFVNKLHNHPSVVLTACASEARNEVYRRSHRAAFDATKEVDMQNRPINVVCGNAPNLAAFPFTDVMGFHIYPGSINGHAFDNKQLIVSANLEAWRYVKKVTPIINWEGGGAYPYVYNREIDKVRKLWTQVPPDKTAIVSDIEGKDVAYHMEAGARWMSMYGIRRIVIDDYAKAEKTKTAIMSYCQRYTIGTELIAARLCGDLYQGTGLNSGRFYDAFTLIGMPPTRSTVYFFPTRFFSAGPDLIDHRVGAANGFNAYKRYSNPRLICLDPTVSKDCFAGRAYTNTIYAINDTGDQSGECSIRAVILDESGKVVCDKTASIGKVPSFKRKLVPFEWVIPAGAPSTTYTLNLFLLEDDKVVSDGSFVFHGLGKDQFAGKIDAKGKKVALYDVASDCGFPVLSTATILDDLGLKYDRISDFKNLDKYDVLLIGAASMDNKAFAASDRINSWLKNGKRMVIFEQELPGQIAGIPRLSIVKKNGGCVVDMVELRHPVFNGLHVNDYWSLWNGELPTAERYGQYGGIYAALIGPLNDTVVGTGLMATPRATTKAVQMCMSDVKVGDGVAFLSQAEATRRYGKDSVATKYLRNVVEYAVSDVTEFSTPLARFSISAMDFYNFGYVDFGKSASEKYESDAEWRKRLQEKGLADLGELRFIVDSSKALKLVEKDEPTVINLPADMKLMYPEREEKKVLADTDQGTLSQQQMESLFLLTGVTDAKPDVKVGECVFSYVDGSEEKMDLIRGRNTGLRDGSDTLSDGASVGNGFYVSSWINPHADKMLRSISIKCTEPGTEILFGGITALLMREKIHD